MGRARKARADARRTGDARPAGRPAATVRPGLKLAAPRSVLRGANGQTVGLDWIRCSGPTIQVQSAVSLLASKLGEPERGRGRYFLGESWRWGESAGVYFDANKDHCVVEITGGGLTSMDADERVKLLHSILALGMAATRVDVAIDFLGEGIELIEDMDAACTRGELCGARTWGTDTQRTGSELSGRMVRIGKRGKQGSGRYVRCYDKGLEAKECPAGEWVRFEVEFADDCARQAAMRIATAGDWIEAAREVAFGAVEFREVNGSAKRLRRPIARWWQQVIERTQVECVKATRRASNLDNWAAWMGRCVAPAIVAFASKLGGTDEVLNLLSFRRDDERVWRTDIGREFMAFISPNTTPLV